MKTFIITGANGNLGTACVKTFLDAGHAVIAVDGQQEHLGFATQYTGFSFFNINLTDEATTAIFIADLISKYGKIDGALMLVGGFAAGNIAAAHGAAVRKMFSLNFETAYFMTRPLLQHMHDNDYGGLVFIGARPALEAAQGKDLVAYSLTKSLLFRLAELINETEKGKNINALVVVPSTIDTPLNRKSMPDADHAAWVTPEALADLLAFAVSDKSSVLKETVLKAYNKA